MRKHFIHTVIAFFSLSVLFVGCGKYEEGPSFSLASKKSRIEGEWKIEQVLFNGTDKTSDVLAVLGNNYMVEFEKDGKYKVAGNFPDEGTWELGEDKDDVYTRSNASGSSEVALRILKLKSKEMWVKHVETNGDTYEYHYKQ